ncbi:hypothetical protein ACFSL6_01450 [Paenibacillus thailandensis]|uniref:CobQ/CobB/MinD/ParA nucleotide binding domain-containing protein n=2 Tax=Paenibacillus thailandensis TaxID=393250 RepID=A0ABW5R2P7_9BACL
MRVQIAVVVKEEEYARRLADYVRTSSFGEQWQLAAFTQTDAFVRHLQGGYPVDLVAIQPSMLEEIKEMLPGGVPVVLLVGVLGATRTGYGELLQYQPVPELLNGFAAAIASYGAGAASTDGKSFVAVIASPVGRAGKTTLALHLAQAAAARNRRPFYLNLELWNGSDVQLGTFPAGVDDTGEGLSELLYCVQSRPGKGAEWLAKHALRHPYWKAGYVRPCSNPEDRLSLAASDAAAVIEEVKKAGYDYIVVEASGGMDELQLGLMELSDRIAWLVTDDPVARHKSGLALRYAEKRWPERYEAAKRRLDVVAGGCAGQQHDCQAKPAQAAFMLPDVPKWRHAIASAATDSPMYRAAVDRLYMAWSKEGALLERSGMVG